MTPRKATLFVSFHLQNRVFDLEDPVANRDNCQKQFFDLRESFRASGVELATQDINPPEDSNFTIYHDFPRDEHPDFAAGNSFLWIREPPVVKPESWKSENWKGFQKIFTYDDSLVDNQRVFQSCYAHQFPTAFPDSKSREKFAVTIIGNHKSSHPFELYSERAKIVRWFETNEPERLDFFGPSDSNFRMTTPGILGSILRKKEPLFTYKGPVTAKLDVLRNYKFCFCLENCRNVNGYISEKPFDAFFAGTVPVYLGAPNVDRYLPKEAFVDYGAFTGLPDLFEFLSEMDERRRREMVECAQEFLQSEQSSLFDSRCSAEKMAEEVLRDLSP